MTNDKDIIQQILGKHVQNGTIYMLKINVEDLSAEIVAAMRPVNQEMLEALKEIEQLDSLEGYKASRIAKQAILSAESGNSKNVVVGAYTYRFEPDKPAWGIFYPDGTCYGDTRSEKDAAEWCGELNRRLAESGKGEK